ncbi:Armadillo-type fold [Trinorchestia longiramus]|nr:Armadillo-type fold [Trinorchestia longiramus]
MKFQLVLFGCLIALVACKPTEDASTARLLLRSCDHNADNALNAAEFAGCLMQTSRQQRIAAQRMPLSRRELLRSFMDEADLNNDLRADEGELQKWSERFFLSGLFGGNDDGDDGDDGYTLKEILNKFVVILQYISDENYGGAVIELYAFVSGEELGASSQISISLAITAIENGNYGQAIGHIYYVIREIAGGDDAGGIFVVSANTVTNVASLLQAVIQSDTVNMNFYIYRSLAGIIVDFTFLSRESASTVAALIQAVIEDNTDEIYASLKLIIKDIPDISTATATALTELIDTVVSGQSSEITVKIIAVFSAILEDDSAAEVVEIFVGAIQAVVDGDSEEAIKQLTLLYAKISGGSTSESGFSSDTVATFAAIIQALEDEDGDTAVTLINVLISSSSSGLSSSQISTLEVIIQTIESNEYDEAIADIVVVATSAGSSNVEISADVYVALSSVIIILENSGDADEVTDLIEEILSDSSLTISVEIRSALRALITVLSEGTTEEALVVFSMIMSGSSQAFERSISSEVEAVLELIFTAIDDDNSDDAIVLIEALLEGERGGSSLSIVVKDDLKKVLKALKSNKMFKAFAQLSIISVESRSSSLSVSATTTLLVAIEFVSSGSKSDAIAELELLLEDEDLESSFKVKIEAIIEEIEAENYSKALTALAVSMTRIRAGPWFRAKARTCSSDHRVVQVPVWTSCPSLR